MEKMKMHSEYSNAEGIEKLAKLFPSCVTESKDLNGKIKQTLDFDQLKQELSSSIIEGPLERYQLNWPGKREALLAANSPITKTLRPQRNESVDFDSTNNIFIEGDNLDALALLQEAYLKKIKLIYIDPPYNTGTNLIYKNDYSIRGKEYLEQIGALSEEGERLEANPLTNGRFHSDWLSMIYSRLKISKRLLADDGVLVCAIDENEFSNLSIVIKEIFGEGGYCHDYVSVVHNPRGQQGTNFSYVNEYLIFVYPKESKKYLADFKKNEIDVRNLRDSGTESDRTDAKNCFYPFIVKGDKIIGVGDVPDDIFHPNSPNIEQSDGSFQVWPISESGEEKKWRYARQSVDKIIEKLHPKMGRTTIQINYHKDTGTIKSVWSEPKYDSSEYGSKLLDKLVPGAGFTYPKSLWAVYDCIYAATAFDKNAIILDFFAGSSTTAHAVMEMNAINGGNRRFIMIQAPQTCEANSKPYKNGFKTISDISKERIRKAGIKIKERDECDVTNLDIGFRVFKVDESNMKDVYYLPDETSQLDLLLLSDNIKEDRTSEDLLFQVLLDWGVDLTLPINRETILGKEVFFVDGNALAACFDKEGQVDVDFCRSLASRHPLRVVFRDAGFESDSVKINVEQIFRQISPSSDLRTI
ncbi:site-specific DNA-methyltransferase [Gammaproteobacteria bacterium]|nr:site-specific DNA-methyltransferase [Gammaproteobacteria bacterium]